MNETYTQDDYDSAYKDAYDAAYAEGLAAAHAEAERDIAVAMERAKAVGCAEKLDTKLAELRSQGHSPAALAASLATSSRDLSRERLNSASAAPRS